MGAWRYFTVCEFNSYLVEFVLLAELYTLSPAVVALVQISSNTSKLNQFMFL